MGNKKKAALKGLSKKERRKLEERAAAEREKAERKAAKKKSKKKSRDIDERVKPLNGEALDAAITADIEAGKARQAKAAIDIDAEIRARLAAKRNSMTDADAPGSPERVAAMQDDVAAARAKRETEADPRLRALAQAEAEVDDLTAKRAKKGINVADDGTVTKDAEIIPSVEVPPDELVIEEFGKPSEAPKRWEDDTNGLGQYKVLDPATGKIRGYTRVTTYIDALEDKKMLTDWRLRILLEGVAVASTPGSDAEFRGEDHPIARINDLMHRRDVAIAKARKADRKGKLVPGQLATIVEAATRDFKRAMNALADELFELGGGREKATKGTDIHALCDLYDAEGIEAVGAKLEAGEITPSDLADVEAYARATSALGLKVVAAEQVVVHDDLKVAGRLDRVWLAKLPAITDPKTGEVVFKGDTRARRYVGDLKTGNVEYGIGKIAQQISLYAEGQAYDPDTHERSSHGANRTHGLLIHLPAGTGTCTIHVVDLGAGRHGNKIVGEVRAFRNSGKKAIDLKTDLVTIAQAGSE